MENEYAVDAYPNTAFISEPSGHDVAYLARLARSEDGNGFASEAPLTDEAWQRLINTVAAAPEMLHTLRCIAAQLHESLTGASPWPNNEGWRGILHDIEEVVGKVSRNYE